MLTKEQAAESLGISQRTLDKWVASGRIRPSDERGYYNAVLISEDDVERARAQRATELVGDLERLGYSVTIVRK